jgi:CheY-like chemotaxis protein
MMSERRVLVIDDSRVIRQVAEMVLGQCGWEVLSAESGREGVAIAARDRPDAILLDVIMPDPNGLATLLELRNRPETCHIPVVFLTAQADKLRESCELSMLGVSGLIAKPFAPNELARTVGDMLGWPE